MNEEGISPSDISHSLELPQKQADINSTELPPTAPLNAPETQSGDTPPVDKRDLAKAFASMLSGLETTQSGTQFNPNKVVPMHTSEELANNPSLRQNYEALGRLASETNERVMDARGVPQNLSEGEIEKPKKGLLQRIKERFKK
jgi:hypothetical protein